ncbi:hypothetical protein JCM8547_003718 [Rhodosporidiobolus lusitaniae]
MPIKRSAEEGGRPPLARGSACHRCFARKVRCSGQPDAASGMHACTSCLRTARFKGHDLALARCAFNGEGLCSEEGGVNMQGETYANAGPGPTPRRKMGSRSSTTTSTSSARSQSSHNSGASLPTSDFSFDSPALGSTISPVSSSTSLKSLADAASAAPSPELYHLPPPVQYQLPPMMPPRTHYGVPQPQPPPHLFMPPYYPASTTTSLPSTPAPGSPSLVTPTAANPCPGGVSAILARRSKAAPMNIALPPNPAQAMGLSPVVSRAPSPVESASAPLAPPANWGQPAPHPVFAHPAPPLSLDFPAPAPPSQQQHQQQQQPNPSGLLPGADPLAGAMQSVLTPGTLAKLPTASYDFSLAPDGTFPPYVSGAPATPSLGLGVGATSFPLGSHSGFTPGVSAHAGGGGGAPPPLPTPFRSLSISELYPPSFTPGGGIPTSGGMSAAGGGAAGGGATYAQLGNGPDFDPSAWSGSFHLPSPGLTFSSSTPYWYGQAGGPGGQGQYFHA